VLWSSVSKIFQVRGTSVLSVVTGESYAQGVQVVKGLLRKVVKCKSKVLQARGTNVKTVVTGESCAQGVKSWEMLV
jgi:hypothetical protein